MLKWLGTVALLHFWTLYKWRPLFLLTVLNNSLTCWKMSPPSNDPSAFLNTTWCYIWIQQRTMFRKDATTSVTFRTEKTQGAWICCYIEDCSIDVLKRKSYAYVRYMLMYKTQIQMLPKCIYTLLFYFKEAWLPPQKKSIPQYKQCYYNKTNM